MFVDSYQVSVDVLKDRLSPDAQSRSERSGDATGRGRRVAGLASGTSHSKRVSDPRQHVSAPRAKETAHVSQQSWSTTLQQRGAYVYIRPVR